MATRKSLKWFINRCEEVHGNKYDYSSVTYTGTKNKVSIICKLHGMFEQEANHHLKGGNCKKCYITTVTKNNELFIKESKEVHNSKYDYSLVEYQGNKSKIKIICKEHGVFEQEAKSHLQGFGCSKCNFDKNIWKYSDWQKAGENSKNFDSFKVYIIRCWNEKEKFYKIGKTFLRIKNRFHASQRMPYNYEVIKVFEGESREVSKLEKKLQKNNKKHKYTPNTIFGGMHECFYKIENYDY